MYQLTKEELEKMGAGITTKEIKQQPELWLETKDIYQEKKEDIANFLDKVTQDVEGKVRVIFTGAGTSQYVGDTVKPYLNENGDDRFYFESIGTTDIVSAPLDFLRAEEPTVLVSFARSGNSPESLATVEIANEIVDTIFHISITCAPEGKLAQQAKGDDKTLLLLMPSGANDQGFAMTGSFSCMSLMSLMVFDQNYDENWVSEMVTLGHEAIERETEIQKIVDLDFNRVVYLGSGALSGLTREASLKILELTAGKIATVFDSSMGFRHGPKSFLDEKTLFFTFVNNNAYTKQYDLDILQEVFEDGIAESVVAIGQAETVEAFAGGKFAFKDSDILLPDAYAALPFLMVAQTVSLLSSIKVGNTPDTPSPTGTVNRVVKGVTIHKF